ncbi:MAG TPA: hypothetical protein DIU07_12995 [Rhodobacteraceae bacterium]|nr:hypothetical protein [Paracoccaceae bacterium]
MPPRWRTVEAGEARCQEGDIVETEVHDVIERIYAAGSERTRWNDLFEAIPELSGGEAANMLVARPKTAAMTVLSPRTDATFVDAFFTEWWSHDPTHARTLSAPVGQGVTRADTGRESFLKSRFHNEL